MNAYITQYMQIIQKNEKDFKELFFQLKFFQTFE